MNVNELKCTIQPQPARPISAFSHRDVKTLELEPDQFFTPQVFDPVKTPKTPRPMANVISRNRSKRQKQRDAAKSAREFPDNQENFEVTGYPSLLNSHQAINGAGFARETSSGTVENGVSIKNETRLFINGGVKQTRRPILLIDTVEVVESPNEQSFKNNVTGCLLDDDNYPTPDDVSINSPIEEEANSTNDEIQENNAERISDASEQNILQVVENYLTGLDSDTSFCNFDEPCLEVDTTFSSEQDACAIQVSEADTIPQYKVEKYNITNQLSVDPNKMGHPKFEETSKFRVISGENEYNIICDEPWGFENYYPDFLPSHLANLDFDSLASVNKDWRFATGDILPTQEESSLLDRLLEISKYQVSTVRQEEEQKRPRYMRPRSSQLSQASSNYLQSAGAQENNVFQKPSGNPVTRARSALASLSSRYCTECKQTPCHESCRYYMQPPPKTNQVFRRCYLCRQMNCQNAQTCSQLKKIRATQSARTKKNSVTAKTLSVSARGPRTVDGEKPKHRSNSGLSTFESQKNLVKYCTESRYNRPKSAEVSSTLASQQQYSTSHRAPLTGDETSCKYLMKQVNLSDDLAEFLETDEGFKNNYPPYLPKPPPGSRDLMTLNQKVAALSLPVARLAKPKTALSTVNCGNRVSKGKSGNPDSSASNLDPDKNLVKLLIPRIALPCQPEPPSVYVSVYRSHNLTAHSGRLRGTKRFGGRLTAFT